MDNKLIVCIIVIMVGMAIISIMLHNGYFQVISTQIQPPYNPGSPKHQSVNLNENMHVIEHP